MSRVILAFARHGDYQQLENTPSAYQPFGLNENGLAQTHQAAKKFSAFIKQENWQVIPEIDSSQMLRAWQTAEIFRETLQHEGHKSLKIQSYDALAERSVGAVANLNIDQIASIVRDDPRYPDLPGDWKSDSYFCLPFQGAESLMDAGKRVAAHLTAQMSAIPRGDKTQVKLCFGHGAAFRHAAFHMGVLSFEHIAALSMFHSEPILLELAEDGCWHHIGGEWKVRAKKNDGMD